MDIVHEIYNFLEEETINGNGKGVGVREILSNYVVKVIFIFYRCKVYSEYGDNVNGVEFKVIKSWRCSK